MWFISWDDGSSLSRLNMEENRIKPNLKKRLNKGTTSDKDVIPIVTLPMGRESGKRIKLSSFDNENNEK